MQKVEPFHGGIRRTGRTDASSAPEFNAGVDVTCYRNLVLTALDAAERVAHVRTYASLSAGGTGG
jgi:hypothetical protein